MTIKSFFLPKSALQYDRRIDLRINKQIVVSFVRILFNFVGNSDHPVPFSAVLFYTLLRIDANSIFQQHCSQECNNAANDAVVP